MKIFFNLIIIFSLILSSCSQGDDPITVRRSTSYDSTTIFFEDGICKCPNASVGEKAVLSNGGSVSQENNIEYIVVDNSTIRTEISNGNFKLCTTLVSKMNDLFKDNSSFNSDISFL